MTDDIKRLLVLDEETEKIILHNIKDFRGIGHTLESALGALVLGQAFGWRVLKLLHTPATYRRYEKVLGIEFKNVCEEATELGKQKSIGYAITEKLGSFWAVVMGKRKVADKAMIGNKEEVKHAVDQIDQEDKK
jgi:hypothetical protein